VEIFAVSLKCDKKQACSKQCKKRTLLLTNIQLDQKRCIKMAQNLSLWTDH